MKNVAELELLPELKIISVKKVAKHQRIYFARSRIEQRPVRSVQSSVRLATINDAYATKMLLLEA